MLEYLHISSAPVILHPKKRYEKGKPFNIPLLMLRIIRLYHVMTRCKIISKRQQTANAKAYNKTIAVYCNLNANGVKTNKKTLITVEEKK